MKRPFSAALAALLWAAAALAAPGDGLDGTLWRMRVTGIRRLLFWKVDTLAFKDGAFNCRTCAESGYSPGAYVVTEPGTRHWIADLLDGRGNAMVWEGKMEGSAMRGSATRVDAQGRKTVFRWTARPAPPPAK